MADYSVGNIEIGIKSNSLNAINGIDKTITKLQEFKKIDKELQNIFLRINQMSNGFSKLSKINVQPLNQKITEISKSAQQFVTALSSIQQPNFADTANSLNKLANAFRQLDKLKNLDFKNLYFSVNTLNRILDPFLKKLKESEASLVAMASVLNNLKIHVISRASRELDAIRRNTEKISQNTKETDFGKMFNIGKIYFLFNYTKRIIQGMGRIIASAIDFNETLNKFQVSMGRFYDQSLKFVNDITNAFNLSTESIMNYMSTFKNMLSALGNLSEDTSYKLSETLTRMALDYASLFNVEVNRAMEQFQAVLSGQIRSIRSVSGYDVSENSIFNIYKELGGTKTMRQLDQVEKRLLRIIAIQQQMEATGAVGDFEKTINTTANQLKQLSETFKELGRWVGQYLMFAIEPLIKYTLSFVIALKEVFKYLNIVKGYKYEDFGGGGLFGSLEESAENAEDAVNSLNNKLLGFDTLNVLGDTSTTATSEDYDTLISKIKEYQSGLENVSNKANEISKSILKWLGYTYKADGTLNKTGHTLDIILGSLGSIISLVLSSKIFSGLAKLFEFFKSGSIGKALSGLPKSLGIISAIIAAVVLLYNMNEDFKKSIDGLIKSIGDVLLPIFNLIGDLIITLMPVIMKVINAVAGVLAPIITSLLPIISAIGRIIEVISPLIITWVDIIANVLVWALDHYIVPLLSVITGIISGIVDMVSGLFDAIVGVFSIIVAVVRTIVELIHSLITGDFSKLGDILIGIWEGAFEHLKGFLNGIIKLIASFVNMLVNLINKLSGGLSGLWEWIGIPAIPKIPEWNPTPLATGGVITKPTHALVGEYAGANSNPEIVTPENLMREVFLDSMLPVVQAVVNGNREVVVAIEDLANRPVELNGRKVSENIYADLQNVALRKGKKLAF